MIERGLDSQKEHGILSFRTKLWFGFAALGDSLLINSITHSAIIYNLVLKIDMWKIGIVLAIPRVWDAVTDPLMGNITDNTRSRWGRRRPYVLFGGLTAALLFFLTLSPPTALGSTGLLIYLMVLSVLFFTAYTAFSVCYGALGLEMSQDYHERTRVMGFRAFFNSIGGAVAGWGLPLAMWSVFSSQFVGTRVMGLLFGVIAAGAIIVTVLGTREAAETQTQAKIDIVHAFKYTISNRQFLILIAAMVLFLLTLGVMLPLQYYVNFFYVFDGDIEVASRVGALGGTIYNVLALITIIPITWLGTRLGKRNTFAIGLFVAVAGALSTWFLFTPRMPYLQLVAPVIMSFALPAALIFPPSILADICDLDELKTGLRREGMFGATLSFSMKLIVSSNQALLGFALWFAGFDQELESQSLEVLFKLRLMMVVIPVVMLLASGLLLLKLHVPEERIREVRRLLEERRREEEEYESEGLLEQEPFGGE